MSKQLKKTYRWVRCALGAANRELDRAAAVGEVIENLSDEQRGSLEETYANGLSNTVAKILRALRRRDLISSPGKASGRRYYRHPDELEGRAGSEALLPSVTSNRQAVQQLLEQAVERYGRAVRVADLYQHYDEKGAAQELKRGEIQRSVQSLVKTGEVEIIGQVRGDGGGRNLYLPAGLDADAYRPERPLTWLGEVLQTFWTCWQQECKRAHEQGRAPRPLTTGDVRGQLRQSTPDHPKLEDPQLMVNALGQLARTEDAEIRTVERPDHFRRRLWAPADVPDGALDLATAYAADSERLEGAVQRAVNRTGQPAVELEAIREEIKRDSALKLEGDVPLYAALGDLTKETVDHGGQRKRRGNQRVYNVGKVAGAALYAPERGPEVDAYVHFRQMSARWGRIEAERRFGELKGCQLQDVAVGRDRLLRSELQAVHKEAERLASQKALAESWTIQIRELARRAHDVVSRVEDWLGDQQLEHLPAGVDQALEGWTPAELQDHLVDLYPRATEVTPAQLVPLLDDRIRRVPNPNFENRRSGEHETATEYLFERTDALITAALQWGEVEAQLQATVACEELGRLRDARYVEPSLGADNVTSRFVAVACWAFLTGKGKAVLTDIDAPTSEAVAWASGMNDDPFKQLEVDAAS